MTSKLIKNGKIKVSYIDGRYFFSKEGKGQDKGYMVGVFTVDADELENTLKELKGDYVWNTNLPKKMY